MKQDHSGIIALLKFADTNPEDCSIDIDKVVLHDKQRLDDDGSDIYDHTKRIRFRVVELMLGVELQINYYSYKHNDGTFHKFAKNVAGYEIIDDRMDGNGDGVIVKSMNNSLSLNRNELGHSDETNILKYCLELVQHQKNLANPSDSYKASLMVKKKLKNINTKRSENMFC